MLRYDNYKKICSGGDICYRKWLAQCILKVGGKACVWVKKGCDGARGILPAIERKDRGTPSVLLLIMSLRVLCAKRFLHCDIVSSCGRRHLLPFGPHGGACFVLSLGNNP